MEGQDLSLRVASFSYYLNPEDSFVQKIWPGSSSNLKISKTNNAGGLRVNNNNKFTFNNVAASSRPVQDPTVAFILPGHHQPPPSKKDVAQVSIFKAADTSDYATVPGGIKYANPCDFKSATSSVCSSESSSQMVLLPNIIKHNKKGIGRRLFLGFGFGFGCRSGGPCSDNKAVFISHSKGTTEPFATNCGHSREENGMGGGGGDREPARKSLEVFGADKKGGMAGNLERKLSMLTWDAIPPNTHTHHQNQNNNNNNNPPAICDDRASDASSDLFEIEDISSSAAGYGYGASRSTAGCTTTSASGCSSPTHYAPSEASIQWSVVTASAADYASDYYCDEKCNSIDTIRHPRAVAKAKNTTATAKSSLKSRSSGGLLGCNSYKAVSVANTADSHQLPKLGNHTQLSYARNV